MNRYAQEDLFLMLKIRAFEEMLLDSFAKGLIAGTTHTCLGQEYIPVSLKPLVRETDFVISNHRGHGHFITFTGEIAGLFAEIMGKEGAVCGSVGGSQHLFYKNVMTTGVQGEGVSIGLGVAWDLKKQDNHDIVYVFVGDGTFGRGSVYESLNMACLYRLPYVLVVENNGIAMTTKLSENMAGTIEARARAFGAEYVQVTSSIPSEIRAQVQPLIQRVREQQAPLVIEFITTRVASHSKGDDTRAPAELEQLHRQYWYEILKRQQDARFELLDAQARQEVNLIFQQILNAKEISLSYGNTNLS